jgi:protein-disulfide isomerase
MFDGDTIFAVATGRRKAADVNLIGAFAAEATARAIVEAIKQAVSLARAAKITGTPALVVAGKYHIGARKAGGQANMLKVADYLIEKERAAAAR